MPLNAHLAYIKYAHRYRTHTQNLYPTKCHRYEENISYLKSNQSFSLLIDRAVTHWPAFSWVSELQPPKFCFLLTHKQQSLVYDWRTFKMIHFRVLQWVAKFCVWMCWSFFFSLPLAFALKAPPRHNNVLIKMLCPGWSCSSQIRRQLSTREPEIYSLWRPGCWRHSSRNHKWVIQVTSQFFLTW